MPVIRNRSRTQYKQAVGGLRQPHGPAIDGLPMLRTTERGTFKRCRWKWWMEFEERLKPKTDVPPLRFGNLIHGALRSYYPPGRKRGPRPWITFEKLYEEECKEQEAFGFRVDEDEVWAEAGELGQDMLKAYVEHYTSGVPDLPDEEFEVLVTEYPFQTVVNHPIDGQPWFIYVGILDGVWMHLPTKRPHIVDHKTARAIQLKYLAMDDQSTAYWTWGLDNLYARGILDPKIKPGGMLFSFLRKAFQDDRPQDGFGHYLNKDGSVSAKQPAPYFARVPVYRDWNERESARSRVLWEFLDMEMIRRAEREEGLPPGQAYKSPGQFTCPGCGLFDMCELHEIGQDWEEFRGFTMRKWDPYDVHEIEASERK